MITITLVLRVGKLDGELQEYDSIDLETTDNINDVLKQYCEDYCSYAELWLETNHCAEKFLIASFKRIKTKTNDGKKDRWILVD